MKKTIRRALDRHDDAGTATASEQARRLAEERFRNQVRQVLGLMRSYGRLRGALDGPASKA